MPNLSDHPSTSTVKILIASDSGTGKTGGMASLVDAGYNLHILDFDNGVSTLRGFIKDRARLATGVQYIPLRDELELIGARVGIKKAPAFPAAMTILEKGSPDWGDPNPGPVRTWTNKDVLVIDTLSSMGRAALWYVMQMNAAGMKNPEIQHYGLAMDNLEKFLGMITADNIPCNVIVNTHISPDEKSGKVFPEALGSKLNPKIGRYFDNLITISTSGGRKQYRTKQDGIFACKTAIPLADNYPLDTGLLSIFQALQQGKAA